MAIYEDTNKQISIGSYILVRLNYCDEEGEIVEQKQFHGHVHNVSDEEVVIRNKQTGKEVSLPPMFGSYIRADKGTYDLPSLGETIVDPDFITEWTLRASSGK